MSTRTSRIRDPILADAVRRLVSKLKPVSIYLFGSQARGNASKDSDYDLLVVVEERTGQPYEIEQQAYGVLQGLGAAVDVVVVTRDRFDRQRAVVASLPATVGREGQLLYAT